MNADEARPVSTERDNFLLFAFNKTALRNKLTIGRRCLSPDCWLRIGEFKLAIIVTGLADEEDDDDELDGDRDRWFLRLDLLLLPIAADDDLCSSRLPLFRAPMASSLIVLMSELEYLVGES